MFQDLAIMRQAGALGRHAAARQRLVAENVAQASTPRALARDLAPFAAARADPVAMRRTRPGHVAGAETPTHRIVVERHRRGPNGNAISIEAESLRATRIEGQHRLAVAVYAKAQALIRLGLGRQR